MRIQKSEDSMQHYSTEDEVFNPCLIVPTNIKVKPPTRNICSHTLKKLKMGKIERSSRFKVMETKEAEEWEKWSTSTVKTFLPETLSAK